MTLTAEYATKRPELKGLLERLVLQPGLACYTQNGVLHAGQSNDYAGNFGLQWTTFQTTQYDSRTGHPLTEDRLRSSSGWDLADLKDKLVLEIGSGAGRFTEILKKYGAIVITLDLSSAIYVNKEHNDCPNIAFIRCSLDDLTCLQGSFDFVLCYGVVQHTPDPATTYRIICSYAKVGGLISADQYRKVWYPSPFYHPKYLWRPVTTRLRPEALLNFLRGFLPYYLKFDTLLLRILPKQLAMIFRGCIPIPCWNYYGKKICPQDPESLLEWAIMDTFDALGAKYDFPASVAKVKKWVNGLGLAWIDVKKGGNGIVFNGRR
jgi:SAM-dependent methyltransferase